MARERSGALLILRVQAFRTERPEIALLRAMGGFYFVGAMAAARVEFRLRVNALQRDGAIEVHWEKPAFADWVVEVLKAK